MTDPGEAPGGRRWQSLSPALRQYMVVTGNYWVFTLSDGALRMLVVLYFYQLGYRPLEIALLFLFYEVFGVITNLIGGWLGAHLGLNRLMHLGLFLQVLALSMLLVPAASLTVPWVMAAQALSGIAKDLNKMSAKSAIKHLVPDHDQSRLYHWIAILTGSKNALKGCGFFLGGVLLSASGFQGAILSMTVALALVWIASLVLLKKSLGRASSKPRFRDLLSRSSAVNLLSAARLFLFGARDVWFVIALPLYLASELGWQHWSVSAFLALWIIGYGLVQGLAPRFTGAGAHRVPDGRQAQGWAIALALVPLGIALALELQWYPESAVLLGLLLFGVVFAINSSLHSYLIVRYARADGVSLDVGFYYMANAAGRLIGTVLSGWLFQAQGLAACLWVSTIMIACTALLSRGLPRQGTVDCKADG